MKNLSLVLKLAVAVAALFAIAVLWIKNNADENLFSMRLKGYESKADSLRTAVRMIDESVHHKDSILLIYLASLNRTLAELDKESAKNKKVIKASFLKQDSIRKAYCREMATLEQHPEECH